jgi:hypothetical protein
MAYDFTTLLPDDFEDHADLLSHNWGIGIEAFKRGKDKSIDLRNTRVLEQGGTAIVQRKLYKPVMNVEIAKEHPSGTKASRVLSILYGLSRALSKLNICHELLAVRLARSLRNRGGKICWARLCAFFCYVQPSRLPSRLDLPRKFPQPPGMTVDFRSMSLEC